MIEVVPYDPRWPAAFAREAEDLGAVLGRYVTGGIHHVGSTSVPGLAAKPVIDIMAGVAGLEAARPCIDLVAALGYCHAPYRADVMHWFCKPGPERRTHHLHLVPAGSERFRDVLAFRDHLRAHPAVAAEYAALKLRLAAAHPDDREAYTDGKAAMVAAVSAAGRA